MTKGRDVTSATSAVDLHLLVVNVNHPIWAFKIDVIPQSECYSILLYIYTYIFIYQETSKQELKQLREEVSKVSFIIYQSVQGDKKK